MTADKIAKVLLEKNNMLILTHKNPDGDTFGSALALCEALRRAGKAAYLMKNGDATAKYDSFIEGYISNDDYKFDTVIAVDVADVGMLKNAEFSDKTDVVIDHHQIGRAHV